MISIFEESKGSILITTFSVMLLFLIFTGSMLFLQRYSIKRVHRLLSEVRAEYLAEAGVYKAIWYLKRNKNKGISQNFQDYKEEIPDYGSYTFSIFEEKGKYIILSQGESWKPVLAIKELKVTLRPAFPPAFEYALYTVDYFQIIPSRVKIKGKIGSQGAILVEDSLISRKYDIHPESNIPFPFIMNEFYTENINSFDYLIDNPQVAQKVYETSQGFNRTYLPDFEEYQSIFVQGRVILEGGSEISPFTFSVRGGTLISSEQIEVEETIRIKGPFNIVAKKGVLIKDNAILEDVVIYSPEKVKVTDNARIKGIIMSKSKVKITDNVEILPWSVIYTQGRVKEGILEGEIIVERNAQIRGTLICNYDPSFTFVKNQTGIYLRSGSEVYGIIYSRNEVQIEGKVNGSVVAKAVKNHILNKAEIDRAALPYNYDLPNAFNSKIFYGFKVYRWEKL